MLRRFLLGALVVSLASMAWAGVPDLTLSIATSGAPAGTSVFNLPNGAGASMDAAFGPGGASVDATITLVLVDAQGSAIFGYPFEDMWLQTTGGSFAFCAEGTAADGSTDANGEATWSGTLRAGGNSIGFLTQVYVAGAPLAGAGIDIVHNSADMNGDLDVNLSDIVAFTQTLATYSQTGDYNNDGLINLSDIVRFTPGIGTICN